MKKWFGKMKLSYQLALVSFIFILIPMFMLWFTTLRSLRDTAVRTRVREANVSEMQFVTEVNRISELCNMSTQVFLNTPTLVEHLTDLKTGVQLDALSLLEFYREDLASLEKIIISNPDLYQIRVYSSETGISEMMPILYDAERMEKTPWADEEALSGVWYVDFDDQLFPEKPAARHLMSLVTDITVPELGRVGVLEVSIKMDQILPELYSSNSQYWAVLIDENGELLAGEAYEDVSMLENLPPSDEPTETRLNGRPVLITQAQLKELNCTYFQVTDISDIYETMEHRGILLMAILLVAVVIMMYAVSRLTHRILRGFYGAFDGLRAFANGDIDAKVEVTGEGEIADFTREAGGLLDKIRQLMYENLEREVQRRNSETLALQNQINAHFIYNVLEAIKMMAEIDEEYEIADAVTSLGKLLRYSMKLESGGVILERELEYIENYVTLMNLRFDYVIRLEVDIPEELLNQRVPKISLQPIVENAVIHGGAILSEDAVIDVCGEVYKEQEYFTITITDRGRGMDEETLEHLRRQISGEETTRASSGNGIGLKNVQDRIHTAFGERFGISVMSECGVGTSVILTLPYKEQEK